VFSSKDMALETMAGLPKGRTYILYRAPLDTFIGFFTNTGELKDGMGQLYHEHYEPS